MANEQARKVLQQGIAAARAGQQAQAQQLLREAVRRDPQSEAAWLWLSSAAADPKERLFCLRKLLEINPNNENALKGLRALGISDPAAAQAQPTTSIPLPDEARINASMQQLDALLAGYRPLPTAILPIEWARKRRGRVGDNSATLLRVGIAAGVLAALLMIGGAVYLLSGARNGQAIAFLATPTNTPTDTPTPSPTVGYTTTPSLTPRIPDTPTSTLPPPATPGSIYYRPNTPSYPVSNSGPMLTGQAYYAIGRYSTAIAAFSTEMKVNDLSKGTIYDIALYLNVLAQVDSGNAERAAALLRDYKSDSALYHAAVGYVALNKGDTTTALSEAQTAYKADPKLLNAVLIAAHAYFATRDYGKAYDLLSTALRDNPNDATLLIARAQASLGRDDADSALADSGQVLVLDPLSESGYQVRLQALLAHAAKLNDPAARVQAYGTAVLAAQSYLLYYPGATTAWLLYAQARQGEGNLDAAIDAYTQAVVSDQNSNAAVQAYLARGNAYLTERRYKEAYDDFDKVVTLPNSPITAHQGRLTAALALQKFDIAREDLDALSRANPSDSSLIVQRLDLQVRQGKFDGVLDQLSDKFVDALPADSKATALLDRGIARYQNGKYDDALKDVNASLSLAETGTAHYYRGRIYAQQKQYQAAQTEYQWVAYWGDVYGYGFASDASTQVIVLATLLPTNSPTPTPRPPTLTPSDTPLPTNTRTPIPSLTPSQTRTPTITRTPSDTPTASNTPTESNTPLPSRTPFPSRTVAPTRTAKS